MEQIETLITETLKSLDLYDRLNLLENLTELIEYYTEQTEEDIRWEGHEEREEHNQWCLEMNELEDQLENS